jgi:hypothetical protein
MTKPTASISLDLDNQWSYMRTHADSGWERYPTYLPELVPLVLSMLRQRGLQITVFIVGQDARRPENAEALRSIAQAGHEIGNHSLNHLQWMHRLPEDELEREIAEAEDAIEAATGQRPRGFRGPGFAINDRTLLALARRGYDYDCSLFPTFLGPLARAYYFMSARKLTEKEAEERKDLFGGVRDGLRPIDPFLWDLGGRELLEIPVTTTPLVRTPLHLSYVLYLGRISPYLARVYLTGTLGACRAAGVEPSFLLHPLDFLSGDTCPALRFFPAMDMPIERKLALAGEALDHFCTYFDPVSMGEHARRVRERGRLARRAPDFA